MRSQKVKNMEHEVAQRAATIANAMAREQLLGDDAPESMAKRMAVLRGRNIDLVRQSWSPFVADAHLGLTLKLRESDALLLSDFGHVQLTGPDYGMMSNNKGDVMITNIAKSKKLSDTLKVIVRDAMTQAIMEKKGRFVRTVLQDLFSPDSHYQSLVK